MQANAIYLELEKLGFECWVSSVQNRCNTSTDLPLYALPVRQPVSDHRRQQLSVLLLRFIKISVLRSSSLFWQSGRPDQGGHAEGH